MSKICISSCVEDARSPVRATYVNLYKWPESDAELVESAAVHGRAQLHSKVVNSISCRQIYLRSYTFSRKETLFEKTQKCLGEVREMVAAGRERKWGPSGLGNFGCAWTFPLLSLEPYSGGFSPAPHHLYGC